MRKKIVGLLVCTLMIATCLPVTGKIITEQSINDGLHTTGFWKPDHFIDIRLRNIYIKECSDEGVNEPGEFYFYIFMLPKRFHWKTDIYSANDNIPNEPQYFGKLCTVPDIKFTPQRIIIVALEDDKGEGIGNFNEFLDWKAITLNPPKGDYPQQNMYEETFKWVNIYFTADILVQFHYITNETAI